MGLGAALEGVLLGGGLIVAIGAQNAFVLRQGLLREHVFLLCLFGACSDGLLILLGVGGFGTLVQSSPRLLFLVTIGGALFLAAYSILAFYRALNPSSLMAASGEGKSLKACLATMFAFTFLNPHVYLDTVVLVGGFSGQYFGHERILFAIGAVTASFLWFFGLGYGARWLVPLFAKPAAWRILDGAIAVIMAMLSLSLIARLI